MRLGIAVAVALACSSAWAVPGPQPTKAEQDEIKKLETELMDLQRKQATFAAAKVARKLFELEKKIRGDEAIQTLRRKEALANLLHQNGADADAVRLFTEVIATNEKLHGPQSHEVRDALTQLDGVYWGSQNFDEIEPLLHRIILIEKQLSGDKSQAYAQQLGMLASMYWMRGEYASAEPLQAEVLAIREANAKTPDDPQLITALQVYAQLLWMSNQRQKAIPLFDRELAIAAKSPNINTGAMFMNGVASLYHYTGRDDLAAPIRKRVMDMYQKEIARLEKDKPDSYELPQMIAVVGSSYALEKDWPNAEKWLTRIIEIDEKRSHFSGYLQALADAKLSQNKPKEALALYERADKELRAAMPKNETGYGAQIASTLVELGEFKRAEEILEKYLVALAKLQGKQAPGYGMMEATLAGTYVAGGEVGKAEPLLADSLEIAETALAKLLKTGTETDHAIYFTQQVYTLDNAINYALKYAPKSANAARMAMTTLLRRKGRVLDAAAASLATIRKSLSADDKKLLDDLASARNQLAKLEVAGPAATGGDDYAKAVASLEDQIQKLEVAVGKKSAAYRVVSQRVDLASVQKMIPKDARLVEIVNFAMYDSPTPRPGGPLTPPPRHYAAFVVGATGDPVVVDLGLEAPIDAAVEAFRKALADPKTTNVQDLGKALYDLTMGKIAPKLGGATNLLVAPDGTLNVIPFSALVDGNRDFLVKTYTFTYLTSGRDLLRLSARGKGAGGGVIFADPSFDGDPKKGGGSRGTRSADLASLMWPPLPGTGQEADAVGKTMSGFQIFRGAQATEGAVKALHGPRILHLATHGFFLPDEPPPKGAAGANAPPVAYENPLLRSGLAFAGANKLQSGNDDGILTALEASGLDLEGTRLVVLSACETGVGKVTNGEGVYGLRRALVIAGAQSLVMSLWQVDDAATKDLMSGYYTHLKAGRGKSSALRDIQLEMLKKDAYAHPFYWASFLPAGDNSPL